MKFGELLKSRREAYGKSLSQVSAAIGVSRGHLHDIEQGRATNPSFLTAIRLSELLAISLDDMAKAIRP